MSQLSSWFRGIKGKLLFAAVLPLLGFASIGFISVSGTGELTRLLGSAHKEIIPNLDVLAEARQSRNKYGYKIFAAMAAIEYNTGDYMAELKDARAGADEFKAAYEAYAKTDFMPEEAKRYEGVKDDYAHLSTMMFEIANMVETRDPQKLATARLMLTKEFDDLGDKVGAFNRDTFMMYNKRAQAEGEEAAATQKSVTQWILMITAFATTLVFGILLWIASRVSTSVSSIGSRLMTAGASVASAVEQLNEAGNSLSQSSTEAAASLEETVASLEELSSMVQLNSDNAKQAAALSASSRDSAEKGQKEIDILIHAITAISQSSKKIEEIISVIDDIAFQTNLLALNAAVEAARAGEQGKGFAVVAEAVRALAQRSAAAAKDITHLIKESVAQVDEGSKIAGQSGDVLNNIVSSVKKVSDLNSEIASASAEQTSGIQQITKAMNQLDQASQSNAASAEEIAATSGEISNLAVTAQSLTAELNQVIHGKTSQTLNASASAPVGATRSVKPVTANVVSMSTAKAGKKTAKAATKNSAQEAIPFDEESLGKVGTTDGF
ncbi:methyl-accepting chemotaxis protein [Bdellovibrio sp. HCB2-146]|uniref:methyl-accepting chemotaxis protein n=1 Tax=Bdellovibrio sp. HCB2-146 TaxID=3394362 RepID=UPI0039BD20EA